MHTDVEKLIDSVHQIATSGANGKSKNAGSYRSRLCDIKAKIEKHYKKTMQAHEEASKRKPIVVMVSDKAEAHSVAKTQGIPLPIYIGDEKTLDAIARVDLSGVKYVYARHGIANKLLCDAGFDITSFE